MNNYEKYKTHMRKIADVSYASGVLNWDQETYMPQGGAEIRAQQLSTLAGIVHELSSAGEFGTLLNTLSADTSLSENNKRRNFI